MYIDNGWIVSLCDMHKNFKPNKVIVWMQDMYFVYWKNQRAQMRIHGISFKEALIKNYNFKLWQKEIQGR
jgi:hypothetical protein